MKKINVEPPPAEVELTITMSEGEAIAFAEFLRNGTDWKTTVGGRTAEAVYDALTEEELAE